MQPVLHADLIGLPLERVVHIQGGTLLHSVGQQADDVPPGLPQERGLAVLGREIRPVRCI